MGAVFRHYSSSQKRWPGFYAALRQTPAQIAADTQAAFLAQPALQDNERKRLYKIARAMLENLSPDAYHPNPRLNQANPRPDMRLWIARNLETLQNKPASKRPDIAPVPAPKKAGLGAKNAGTIKLFRTRNPLSGLLPVKKSSDPEDDDAYDGPFLPPFNCAASAPSGSLGGKKPEP